MRYEAVQERDRMWIMSIDVQQLDRRLVQLLAPYLVLNFIDVISTLVGIQSTTAFRELNPLASALFGLQFGGFAVALVLKYAPAALLTYLTFMKSSDKHPLATKVAKFSGLIVLAAANIFYVYVVGSNLGNLLRVFF